MFAKRLEELSSTAGFFKLCFYKIVWNLTGRKFQAFAIGLMFYKTFDKWQLFALLAWYAGLNVTEKIFGSK